ncbi:hypothetical protein G5B40_02035 [Pikeienuella piscinae]|uniref:Peptidoglycan binding-like domain-containing protein n=1 Tax=Pikeienuella piscinae TaxID=2748098 RepID=A0A7L5BVT9_9RHOB|nr:peptidoglycan-binding domain-containing protein [Pikeienuella piscinae]QIE54326.1 hypothetical protein G5B40_02035 [Pikeienuella piscinae]
MKRTTTALTTIMTLAGALAVQPVFAATESELQFWRSAEDAGQARDYRAYLERYPEGEFAPLAKNRLRDVRRERREDEAETAAAAVDTRTPYQKEAALGLSASDRRVVQSSLVARGYDTRGVDGVFGAGSRSAISGWQAAEGHQVTGYLTAEEYAALGGAENPGALTNPGAGSAAANQANACADDGATASEWREWSEAKRIDTQASYRTYLDRYPNGRHADDALTEIYGVTHDGDASATLTQGERRAERQEQEETLGYDVNQRTQVEQRLEVAGYDPGPVDGVFTRETRLAIASYRKDRHLEHGRYLDREMVRRLVEDTNGVSYSPSASTGDATNSSVQINPNVAAAIAAGALAVGGALLLDD